MSAAGDADIPTAFVGYVAFHPVSVKLTFRSPSFYIARPEQVKPVIAFAFRLLMSHAVLHEGAGYLLGIYCMTVGTLSTPSRADRVEPCGHCHTPVTASTCCARRSG